MWRKRTSRGIALRGRLYSNVVSSRFSHYQALPRTLCRAPPAVFFSGAAVLNVSEVIVEETKDKLLALRWIFLMMVSGLVTTIYIQITP